MILPCGHTAEDDGDRYYDDECFVCGWASPYRKRVRKQQGLLFALIRAEREYAKRRRPGAYLRLRRLRRAQREA